MNKEQLWEKLERAYDYQLPEYILNIGNSYITLNVQEVVTNKVKRLKVTMNDIALYYKTQSNNLSSGMRVLAGHAGDWRKIDELAQLCLDYFKLINVNGMRKASLNYGLTPKF